MSRFILGMPMFRESCSPLHQGEKQSDIDEGLQGSRNIGILRMDLDTEKTHETHNLYRNIEICGSLKNIICIYFFC